VAVVDDGSPDRTAETLDRLVERYPERVIAVHHKDNRGYGAAVRCGIRAAIDHTDLRSVLLTDSDWPLDAGDLLPSPRPAATTRCRTRGVKLKRVGTNISAYSRPTG